MSTTIVWFRQDLRLADHPALTSAVRAGGRVLPVYIWAPQEEGAWPPGAASRWWLHHALVDLNAELQRFGSRLIIRTGDSLEVLKELIETVGVDRVVLNRRYEPAAIARDTYVEQELTARGVHVEQHNGSLLFDPGAIHTRSGGRFQVFTPFWNTCLQLAQPAAALPAPVTLSAPNRWPKSIPVGELGLLPRTDWTDGLRTAWHPGEQAGVHLLEQFGREGVCAYLDTRDIPGIVGTSRLSPYLHWGHLSPRQVWHAVGAGGPRGGSTREEHAAGFRRQLGWREFAYYLLVHHPNTTDASLRPVFDQVVWRESDREVKAWQQGRTGYPLVDAGMRELWHTGWMHNRVRMVTASFLVKHLLCRWQVGARWFWETLVDADLANNTFGWQWSAGCGADAAPYFRVFNPTAQREKFDPEGHYLRQWIPQSSGGEGADVPMVDHVEARNRFLREVQRKPLRR